MTSTNIALSIRQPWAWLVINRHKPIENRTWTTKYRGRVYIHASKGMTADEYQDAANFAMNLAGIVVPEFHELERGGIIGSVEIVDCVTESDSPWFFGKCGFVMRDPKPLPFVACKGQLGLFKLDPAVVRQINAAGGQ